MNYLKSSISKLKIILIVLAGIIALVFGVLGAKLYLYIKSQNKQLEAMNIKVDELTNKIKVQQDTIDSQMETINQVNDSLTYYIDELNALKSRENVKYIDDGINYLAIGNSITKHRECEYWWDEIGMAASSKDRDYVHLVANSLAQEHSVAVYAVNFTEWETQGFDRSETLVKLDSYLDERLDLVTIQLSECVSDITTFEEDYVALIEYICNKAPNAKVIMIDDFWDMSDKHAILQKVSSDINILFVDLSEIKNDSQYLCGLNTTVYDSNGNPHIVLHEGVATHPGDLGMQYYADRILNSNEIKELK